MDLTKKRKLDENGFPDADPTIQLTSYDARKILEPFSHDQLLEILQNAVVSHPDVLEEVRVIADRDVTQRKLFVRGLGWETTSESLRSVFASFGELEEAVVILDKESAKSKGYGFVTYKHIDGAILALKEPSKKIDGRVAVAQLASAGLSGGPNGTASGPNSDVSSRKIYVGNVPYDMPAERLLSIFSSYGEIEEGPLGFDKQTGKSKGFALFVYKTPEAAQASLLEPMKNIDGREVVCKMAGEGKKGKGFVGPSPGQGPVGNGMGMQPGGPVNGPYGGPPGAPAGYSSYGSGGGYSGGPGPMGPNAMNPNSGYPTSVGGGQGPGGYGSSGSYGGGYGGAQYGGTQYGGAQYGGSQYGGPNEGSYGGYGGAGSGGGGAGRGVPMYGMAPNSMGAPSGGGGYPDGGQYGGYPGQPHQPTGTSPATRVPPAGGVGGYPNMPPYY